MRPDVLWFEERLRSDFREPSRLRTPAATPTYFVGRIQNNTVEVSLPAPGEAEVRLNGNVFWRFEPGTKGNAVVAAHHESRALLRKSCDDWQYAVYLWCETGKRTYTPLNDVLLFDEPPRTLIQKRRMLKELESSGFIRIDRFPGGLGVWSIWP